MHDQYAGTLTSIEATITHAMVASSAWITGMLYAGLNCLEIFRLKKLDRQSLSHITHP